jgi:hypothetical protein
MIRASWLIAGAIGLICLMQISWQTPTLVELDDTAAALVAGGSLPVPRDHDEVCVTSSVDYWCEVSSGAQACGAGCGSCSVCSNGNIQFQVRRCLPQEESNCDRYDSPITRDCGSIRNGSCGGAGCTTGTWTSCGSLGAPTGTPCSSALVVESCS